MGSGLFPGVWCSRRQFPGLYPLQNSIKRSRMCRPRVCRLLASFFSTMHWHVHLSGKGPKAGVWTEDGKDLTPGEIVLSSRPAPSWVRDCPGAPTPRASGKAPGKGPTERIQGVSGPAAWASGTGAPENQWGRVNSKPHVPHSASSCGNSRPGVRLRCRRREIGAVVDHLLPISQRMHLESPNG